MSEPFTMTFTDPEDCELEPLLARLAVQAGATTEEVHRVVLHTGSLVAAYAMFEGLLPDQIPLQMAQDLVLTVPEVIRHAQGLIEVAAAVLARCKEMVA